MSDLRDIRSKVDGDVYNMLIADAKALRRTESDLVRDAVEAVYRPRIHAAKVFQNLTRCEGDNARIVDGGGGE